jgi:hypothetical protein
MELEELKTAWGEYDKKLDKNLKLNLQLLRKMNFDKARFRMRWLFVIKITSMCWLMIVVMYLIGFAIKYIQQPQFSIPAMLMILLVSVSLVYEFKQYVIMIHLQLKSSDEAIAPLQKRLETLKIMIVNKVKYALFLIPFYPLLMILTGKIFLNIDFFSPQLKGYLIVNIIFGLLLLPVFIWLYRQLSKKDIKPGLIKNLLPGSGWFLVNDAGDFLKEIDKFEEEN